MHRGKLSGIAVVSAAALLMTGCSADEPTDEPITLRMTVFSDALNDTFSEIAESYIADHPEIASVQFDLISGDYTTALTTQLAGGNAPDMGWMFETDAATFLDAEVLYGLTSTFTSDPEYDFDDLVPAALERWSSEGELYAYPFSTSTFGMFYNQDLLTAAGQPLPTDLQGSGEWTWDSVAETASATAEATGATGLAIRSFEYRNWDNLATIWRGFGAEAWDESATNCTFNSPEMIEAFTFIHDATFAQDAFLRPGRQADFAAGELAYFLSPVSAWRTLADSTFDWGFAPLPAGPAGTSPVFGQAAVGVFTNSEHPQEAAEFLAYFTNPENARKLAAAYPPPRASLLTVDVLSESMPGLTEEEIENVVIAGVNEGAVKPGAIGFNKILTTVQSALDPLWVPDADVPDVLNGVCDQLQPLLGGN